MTPTELLHGIDVSAYQPPTPDLRGSSFCFVKHSEGLHYRNPLYPAQVHHARSSDVVVGHYLFLDAREDVDAQVRNFELDLNLEDGDLIALDWEAAGSTQADRDRALHALMTTFPHHKVGLYCNLNFWRNIDTESNAGDFLWIAQPGVHAGFPNLRHPWHFHQYGESGGIDRNVANSRDLHLFRQWCLEKLHRAQGKPYQHTTTYTKDHVMTELAPETTAPTYIAPGTVDVTPAPAPAVAPETPAPAAPPAPVEPAASAPELITPVEPATAPAPESPVEPAVASAEAAPVPVHPLDQLRALVADLEKSPTSLLSAADLKKAVDIFIAALELAWIK